jgi:two-component system heavy metal sensor histidine kinase CusS
MSSNFAIDLFAVRRWSLTTRLTVFFGAAIAVIVVGVSLMMYAELVHQLHEKEELELKDDMRIQQEVLDSLAKQHAPTRWQREWGEQQEEYQLFAWQLVAADGKLAAASSNAAAFAAPGRTFLTLSMPAHGTAVSGLTLRGILDVSQDEQVLQRYRTKLFGVVAVAIVLSAALGALLARRGLAPVRAISTEIGRINAERLHARIAQEDWPAELRVLAQSFDELMARIEASFDQLSRFSSDLAHEFRSPINNLVAAASVTLGRARTAEQYQNTLEVVVEEGDRLSRMVTSMLFLARADNAKQQLRLEQVSTDAEFSKLLDFFDIVAEEQGVTLEAHGSVSMRADPLLLRQALSNLLANALRYTPRGGTIRLTAQDRGEAVVIAVTDNGAGIGAEHLPLLFDRFYRADPARSAVDSTGLGLAVVRSIAELHGGSVEVESTLGQGARFVLRFPTFK